MSVFALIDVPPPESNAPCQIGQYNFPKNYFLLLIFEEGLVTTSKEKLELLEKVFSTFSNYTLNLFAYSSFLLIDPVPYDMPEPKFIVKHILRILQVLDSQTFLG